MDMHFVGAELGTAMADLSEIERYGLVAGTADTQDCSAAAGLAPHQDVVGRRQFRTFNQAKDRMHVLLARSSAPKLERLYRIFLASGGGGAALAKVAERHNTRKLDDTRTHNS
jgi:hypothetical protein